MGKLQVRYELGDCQFGPILTACTDLGLCMVAFNQNHDELIRSLSLRFPWLDCVEGPADLQRVSVTIEDPRVNYPGRLDLRGTDFQRLVWLGVQTVPYANIATYGKLAEMIKKPKAIRAVAQACGANPIAIIVPCHRIVGKDYTGQYRWGAKVKQQLLDIEQNVQKPS